jgi:tetratricopeptide (TPR) repeat protein
VIELLVLVAAVFILSRQLGKPAPTTPAALAPKRVNSQLIQLTAFADRLYAERRWRDAEKAYLGVLKLDHKNATAYVHLGIIYSTQKNMPDAIECFEIAARLHPSGSTFQNLGLAFYDNKNYIKSIAAYEKAIIFEPHATRYVGVGKSHLKLSNVTAAIAAFETAAKLEPDKRNLQRLAEVYEKSGRMNEARAVYRRIHGLDPSDRAAARHLGIHLPDNAGKTGPWPSA